MSLKSGHSQQIKEKFRMLKALTVASGVNMVRQLWDSYFEPRLYGFQHLLITVGGNK